MGNSVGKFKYVCGDCGAERRFHRWQIDNPRQRNVCLGCGGTCWIPASANAVVDQVRISIARNIIKDGSANGRQHRGILGDGTVFNYKGTAITSVESRQKENAGRTRKLKDKPVIGNTLSAPSSPKEGPDRNLNITVHPIGKAKKRGGNG